MAHTCTSSIWEYQNHQYFKASLSYIARGQPWLHETLSPPLLKKIKTKKEGEKNPQYLCRQKLCIRGWRDGEVGTGLAVQEDLNLEPRQNIPKPQCKGAGL